MGTVGNRKQEKQRSNIIGNREGRTTLGFSRLIFAGAVATLEKD